MTLYELAYACHLYSRDFPHYDLSYATFMEATGRTPNLEDPDHRTALLKWLRSWGCRHFAIEWSEYSSAQILNWYKRNRDAFFPSNKYLWELTRRDLEPVGEAYQNLSAYGASFRQKGEEQIHVCVGQTGAAKILFAMRSNAFAPWDSAIRRKFRESRSELASQQGLEELFDRVLAGKSEKHVALNKALGGIANEYVEYVMDLNAKSQRLAFDCEKHGFVLVDLPRQLRRTHGSVPKLIDDYHWITITNKIAMPELAGPERWVRREFPHTTRSSNSLLTSGLERWVRKEFPHWFR